MSATWTDGPRTILQGDAWALASRLEPESVDCLITSPPYWGLRDYGLPPVVIGGDLECEHEFVEKTWYRDKSAGRSSLEGFSQPGEANAQRLRDGRWHTDATCVSCSAWRGQFGLEPHPQLYIDHLVDLFERLRPALKATATVWLNLGDSYFGGGGIGGVPEGWESISTTNRQAHPVKTRQQKRGDGSNWLRPKQLLGMPWRVAIALQEAGWLLRNDDIWAKTNPTPDSSTTKQCPSHEYIFFFALQGDHYYDLLLEPAVTGNNGSRYDTGKTAIHQQGRASTKPRAEPLMRHVRDVWTGPTGQLKEAHFAVMPDWLAERCIRAGCPSEVCVECGRPKARVVERGNSEHHCRPGCGCGRGEKHGDQTRQDWSDGWKGYGGYENTSVATDQFEPTCDCGADFQPGLVLDPFAGAGTVLCVAKEMGLQGIGFELSEEYVEMAGRRIEEWKRPKGMVAAERASQGTLELGEPTP